MNEASRALIQAYYDAFNAQDIDTFLSLLADDVIHDLNQGPREVGKAAFARFVERMNTCYREHLFELHILTSDDGRRAAVEYTVLGVYLATDAGLPEANGQTYRLPGGAFFEIEDGKITRITNYYNLQDWTAQVAFQDTTGLAHEAAAQ